MNCDNLCTAAKCEELENRLSALEQAIELLQASFEAHTQQDIPEAHNYEEPEVTVSLAASSDRDLKVFVAVGSKNDSETIKLPEPEVTVSLAASEDRDLKVFVAVGSKNDSETIKLPEPEVTVSLAASSDQDLKVFVAVGSKNDSETIKLPTQPIDFDPVIPFILNRLKLEIRPEIEIAIEQKYRPSNLKLGGSFESDILTLTVADGESQDTATISIPLPDIERHVKSNLRLDGSYQSDVLTLTVADGESQDTATITITLPDMNCDNLEQEFKNCCEQLTNLISNSFNNLDNQLNNLENAINTEIKEVMDEITIDISGTSDSYYTCRFEVDDNLNFLPGYAQPGSSERTYTGKGFKGIEASLKIINDNLVRIHESACKAVQPPETLYLSDLYQFCNDSDLSRANYPEGNSGDLQYENAVKAYLDSLLAESKYASLIDRANGNVLINAPQYWITKTLADFSLIQSRINNSKLCNLNKPEETDVVSIVASPKYVTNVEGKVLILHFVTFDNYPKRSRGSNYRQIQIPGAKQTYDWKVDFENLVWKQGNQYAELELNEYRARVSGWFASEAAANTFFDAVLDLTVGTEKNRRYPKQKYPRTDIQTIDTRPYRAFIESINPDGQAICHVKYVPPIDE